VQDVTFGTDGNEFIEYGMDSAPLPGHAYSPVVEAAHQQMLLGTNFTRPSPIEIECAEMLVRLIPSAEMVKFAKNGSDVTTAAVNSPAPSLGGIWLRFA